MHLQTFFSIVEQIGMILSLVICSCTILKKNREKLHARLGTESFAKFVS